ncbi:hypothetical protein A3D84_00480 [Candidatus Woesebacteria bacterium RIFCSPHIGHO2_02_FULL_42_20]|uniref:Integral membrane protein n=1 Tax=Candidatus Woesebacteria bacterium RIFCSPHIGHO2_12_FULL_41_24 TaxID=1802510 RepID=A0A1F8AV66_9BACT|nr:MAG: hypothetical protein A2W15_01980 [Candidatus Woesebacteria bacterium RBG_16_41_13]OGM29726.1 MAG: hypothetical protein A2873_02400 [Candidatus Woesebacteria bacterium RIFCSPHIGHO2_01_FULL_42_80]OGM35254.1 MAG: hypothetical protein A3D84_00480 [Candidatus Woesebacteria bacterium RIFCSPHIGHO2_02_FULL_42_20]OGM55148.1 MAG: hypothetical protein A3E44_04485 [Candidatus Woesebacteria bacterium RIFCSPHIGHO2_12_FULL_41_24]OGM67720.1 MAG: hypothetical protein A2969_02190 [Candidatus Woesebacteri
MPPLNLTNASTLKDLETVFGFLIQSVLALAGVVFFIMLIAGGFKFITSGGDPKKVAEAQGVLTWAVGGLVFIAIAYLILRLIAVFTGVNSILTFNIPG